MPIIAESRTLAVESTGRDGLVLTGPRQDNSGNTVITLGLRGLSAIRPDRLKVIFPPQVEGIGELERGQRVHVSGDSYAVKRETFYEDPGKGRKTTHKQVFEGEKMIIKEPSSPITVRRLHEFLKER